MASGGIGMSSEDMRNETHLTPTDQKHPPTPEHDDWNSDKKVTADSAQRDNERVDVCQFFLMGKCHFGQRCRSSHSEPSLDDSEAVSPDKKDEMEKASKKKAKGNKSTKAKDNEEQETNKKPRMRTADDVISRILWDPSVDSSEFVVGYVDRFLGVLERPFCEFNWETNPCDCDYSSELALPRHRIQYFTYRGHRVWDRHCRTDRVFGSTGQSLAPPFGGEEEVKGDGEKLTVNEERPAGVSGQEETKTDTSTHTQTTHLEGEELSEMDIHTSDSATAASPCSGNNSGKQLESRGPYVVEEAAKRLETSTDQMSSSQRDEADIKEEGEEEIWEESWEDKQDSFSYTTALNLSQSPSAPLDQREEKRGGGGGGRPPKRRPTHFVTFRANTPAILSGFQQLQEEMTSLLPSSAPHWQSVSSLHVTLCLLNLSNSADVAAATEILQRFAHLDRNPPVAVTFPVKLKHFNGRVLFLSPQPQLPLQQLNSGLQEAYRKKGFLHRDSYNPRYHLTLAKVQGKDGERIFEGVGDIKVGKGLNFGRLPVNTLHLCTVGGSTVDGFFETLCSVTLR